MMHDKLSRAAALAALVLLAAPLGCSRDEHAGEVAPGSFERGPHRGRWLEDGAFALELTIFEQGVPPEFRAFVYRDEKPVDPASVELEVTLHRLGERVDRIRFAPRGEYLLGDATVYEPHSFDAEIVAREGGREHRFRFSSYENRVKLVPEQREIAGIEVVAAGPEQWSVEITNRARTIDVRPIIAAGDEPFGQIMAEVAALGDDEVLVVVAPFDPKPLELKLAAKGFGHRVEPLDSGDFCVTFERG